MDGDQKLVDKSLEGKDNSGKNPHSNGRHILIGRRSRWPIEIMVTVISEQFQMFFAPHAWSAVRRFSHFVGPPFEDKEVAKGARVAVNHLDKFEVLAGLTNRQAPTLLDDRIELDRNGFSPALRSREFAALVETLVSELYSSLDGVRRALFGAYRNVEGVQNKSTERLFKRAAEREYGDSFPEWIRERLAAAYLSWFPSLRRLRTEFSHGDVGSCHLDRQSGRVAYVHQGLGTRSRAMAIEDVVGVVNALARDVVLLIDAVFDDLYNRLEPVERRCMCGIYKGRIYERVVMPERGLTVGSGRCFSRSWFDAETGYECPLRTTCGAYARA